MSEYVGMDFGLFAPHQAHSETSRAAAVEIAGKAGTLRRIVYDYLTMRGEHGATDAEMQEALDMAGSTQRPRRVRLCELFLVEDSGRTRAGESGRSAVVWVAV